MRSTAAALAALTLLTACATPPATPRFGPDGQPLPVIYQISARDKSEIQFRMLDSVNALRREAGVSDLTFDPALNAAAATHSRDMSRQNRPWHFGSDGSSPLDRVARAGFDGQMLGENISETYETELETLGAWMEDPATRAVVLEARARRVGFEWYQEPTGKIWWTMVTGT
ncbi:MAG: CAP domain-containing protein [Pseudomonadota bacterium]